MAEERTLATARAAEAASGEADDPTKAELQRRMEEARESITQTVSEIKDTVTTQYQNVRETISQSLDWREQFRRRPVAFAAGAVGVGFLVGYSVGGAFGDDDEDELAERYYEAEGDYRDISVSAAAPRGYGAHAAATGAYGVLGAAPYGSSSPSAPDADSISEASAAYQRSGVGRDESAGRSESFRAAALGSLEGSAGYAGTPSYEAGGQASESRPSYSSGYENSVAAPSQAEEPAGPSLFERFRETQAYDRLQKEVQTLGARAVEELSKTAQNVVLPALLGKLKDMIGLDLSTQREVAQRSRLEHQTAQARTQADQAAESAPGSPGGGAYQTASGSTTP
ncbi:MAG TPA: hypothetical protein VK421_05780 [Pyrinomonadaceae bacterium]|nr:hypothetical protein [Pyrinomonadaceae bacterium]